MKRKYDLTDETMDVCGTTLHRIRALINFNDVKAGDLGGWVEDEDNLSHCDNAWVYGDAKVLGNAEVGGNARVYDNAWVYGDARVLGYARVLGDAEIYGNAEVGGDARVLGNVWVFGYAKIYGDAWVYGYARVFGDAEILGNAEIYGNAEVGGDAKVCGDARVNSHKDYIVFKDWWDSGRYFTWTRSNDMWRAEDFYGTGDELINKAYQHSETSGREYARIVEYVNQIKNKLLENKKNSK